MPWTPAQHRLFEAAAHNPSIAKQRGIPQAKAKKMASEGIKKSAAETLYPSHKEKK
jgi:hypothetical protein